MIGFDDANQLTVRVQNGQSPQIVFIEKLGDLLLVSIRLA